MSAASRALKEIASQTDLEFDLALPATQLASRDLFGRDLAMTCPQRLRIVDARYPVEAESGRGAVRILQAHSGASRECSPEDLARLALDTLLED